MSSERFDFVSSTGKMLSGKLERPETTPRGWAIFAHCFTCGKESLAAVRLSRALALTGIGVLRFDFAGLGASDGSFSDSTFAADVADLLAAHQAMDKLGMSATLLIGHSLGGAAVLAASERLETVKAVATIGAPAEVTHVLHQFGESALAKIEAEGEATVTLAQREYVIRQTFIEDLQRQPLLELLPGLHRPLLILHSPTDDVVSVENAARLFHAARHPKSFISIDGADHLLNKRSDAEFAADVISSWAKRYIPLHDCDIPQFEEASGVVAEEAKKGSFQLLMSSGSHHFYGDEPTSAGGTGTGLSPYEFVAAGLAACTTLTMRMYADRKGYPLEKARTEVHHQKRPDTTPADVFIRKIKLSGPLSDDEREKILSIADRCPVDLTLVRGADVESYLE